MVVKKKVVKKKENNGGNSGHYVVASRPPNGDRLQRRRSCQNEIRSFRLNVKYGAEYGASFDQKNVAKFCFKYGAEAKSYSSLRFNEMLKYKKFSEVK